MTNSTLPTAEAGWVSSSPMASCLHGLQRAAGTPAVGSHAVARGASLRRDLINGWKPLWDRVLGPQTGNLAKETRRSSGQPPHEITHLRIQKASKRAN
jgi:hypothetical protein